MVFIDPLVYFVLMVREQEKYVAYSFNIAGFALMTPLGKLILDALEIYNDFKFSIFFAFYVIFSLILGTLGLSAILFGRGILDSKKGD